MEATGRVKKGKIFGMGSLSRMYMPNNPRSSSSTATGRRRSRQDEQLTHEVTRLNNLFVQKDEQIQNLEQQMQIVMQHLNLNRQDNAPVPPANPIGGGHNNDQHIDAENADDDDDDFLQTF